MTSPSPFARTGSALVVAASLLGSASVSADVIDVTPGGGLQAAVDHASAFDVLLLAPGTYPETVIVDGKGLSLVADGGTATVRRLIVVDVPAGQTFTLTGVTLSNTLAGVFEPAFLARDNAGALRLQDCTLGGHGGSPGSWMTGAPARDGVEAARVVNSSSVTFVGCTLTGGGGATLEDEDFEWFATGGGAGLVVTNSTVLVSDSLVRGGSGGSITDTVTYPGGAGGDALRVREAGKLQVHGSTLRGAVAGGADCDLFNCGSGGSGGDCLELHDPGSSAIARDVVYEPGAGGGDGDGGGSGASGLPQRVLGGTTFDFTASYRDLDASSPVREGQLLTLDFAGEPGDALLLFAGIFGGHVNMIGHQGVFLIAPPLVLPGVFVGVLPAGGLVAAPLVVPEMGPGIEGLDLHLQAVFDDGTTALLGPARVVTLLDAAF